MGDCLTYYTRVGIDPIGNGVRHSFIFHFFLGFALRKRNFLDSRVSVLSYYRPLTFYAPKAPNLPSLREGKKKTKTKKQTKLLSPKRAAKRAKTEDEKKILPSKKKKEMVVSTRPCPCPWWRRTLAAPDDSCCAWRSLSPGTFRYFIGYRTLRTL